MTTSPVTVSLAETAEQREIREMLLADAAAKFKEARLAAQREQKNFADLATRSMMVTFYKRHH